MKIRKFVSFGRKALPFVLIAAILLLLVFFPHAEAQPKAEQRVVKIWNVDTFEGGKGSRTAFLRRAAAEAEKQSDGVYYLITNYTVEGANAALGKGSAPDVLSFGVGISAFTERCLPLSRSFAGGETEEGCLAYPWCSGKYFLFSLTDNFEEEGMTAVSKGGSNLSEVAANLAGISGETVESSAAYVGLLSGKYRYLLGTQRDECRFSARGATVYAKPLEEFSDLYQYVSILSAEKRADCELFLNVLLSEPIQSALSQIGMYPADERGGKKTVSVFCEPEALQTIADLALREADGKNLDKYLKTI